LKESPQELPQIDAQFQQDKTVDYANEVLDKLLRYYSLNQISLHTGICRRSLSYMRHSGIRSFPYQLAMEILSGMRRLDS
jgi:hypothetical protein